MNKTTCSGFPCNMDISWLLNRKIVPIQFTNKHSRLHRESLVLTATRSDPKNGRNVTKSLISYKRHAPAEKSFHGVDVARHQFDWSDIFNREWRLANVMLENAIG